MEENGICSACFLRKRGAANPLSHRCAMPAPPKGGALAALTGRWQKAPPSGELDATNGSGLRGLSRPLGEGGCERSEQTEGVLPGQAALHLIRELSRHAKGSPFGRAVTVGD